MDAPVVTHERWSPQQVIHTWDILFPLTLTLGRRDQRLLVSSERHRQRGVNQIVHVSKRQQVDPNPGPVNEPRSRQRTPVPSTNTGPLKESRSRERTPVPSTDPGPVNEPRSRQRTPVPSTDPGPVNEPRSPQRIFLRSSTQPPRPLSARNVFIFQKYGPTL